MIHLAICDDEPSEITYLTAMVKAWAANRSYEVRLSAYESAENFWFAYEDDSSMDILLLDIQMKKMDGMTLAKKIRAVNKAIQLIFITGYMDYMSDGYEVEALHYLLKPVTGEKLAAVLDRAKDKLTKNERTLSISHAGETIRIPFYEIRYLEVWHNYVTIRADSEYKIKKTLGELETELGADDCFFRVGRSYLVNLRYIKKCTKNEIHLKDDSMIPLPRGFYNTLNRAMIERL